MEKEEDEKKEKNHKIIMEQAVFGRDIKQPLVNPVSLEINDAGNKLESSVSLHETEDQQLRSTLASIPGMIEECLVEEYYNDGSLSSTDDSASLLMSSTSTLPISDLSSSCNSFNSLSPKTSGDSLCVRAIRSATSLEDIEPASKRFKSSTSDTGLSAMDSKSGSRVKNRCDFCKGKVGLIGYACRCGGTFCSVHRHFSKHECGFDYKKHGKEKITKENPTVTATKITKL